MKAAPSQGGGPHMSATEQVTAPLTAQERRELRIRRQMAGVDTERHWMSEMVTGDVFWLGGVRWGVLHFDYPQRRSGRKAGRVLYCIDLDNPGRVKEWQFGTSFTVTEYEPTNPERTAAAHAWWQRICAAEQAELANLRGGTA